jgi:CCR4-NOT transcription complex subunit 7/8
MLCLPACLPACLPVSAHQFMMTAVEGMHGGLNTLADLLQVERLGPKHQAGSDSLLTATTFFAFVNSHFGGSLDESRFQGELFGLGNNYTKFKTKYPNQQAAAASSQYGQTYSSAPQAVQDAASSEAQLQEGY